MPHKNLSNAWMSVFKHSILIALGKSEFEFQRAITCIDYGNRGFLACTFIAVEAW